MLFYIYSNAPSTTIDITSRCRVGRLSVKDQAEEGAVAISSLIIDDPDGDLLITGHRRMYIYESDAPAFNQVIFNGFVVNERVERGPYRTGPGRQWVIDLADPNVFINRRIMNGADANRPAETDLARIQALLNMTELNTVDDDSLVNITAATTAMDAADYRGQNVGQYIDDCRQASGKNAYIRYNETLGQYGLWYDFDYSTAYDSGKFLSNVLADINQTTVFEYSQERTHGNFDPSRVASGIYLEYDGPGSPVYVQDATTTAAFAAIDWAAPSVNVKTSTKATARANRYLADADTEHVTVHTVAMVPRSKVTAFKKGQLISFKSTFIPSFPTYVVCRILNTTITEISEDPTLSFEIEMDLDPIRGPVCPGYALTASGFRPPLYNLPAYGGPPITTDPNQHYVNGGTILPGAPTDDHSWNNWGFPFFNISAPGNPYAPAGAFDSCWAGAGNQVGRIIVGYGTFTAHVPKGPDWVTGATYQATLEYWDGLVWTVMEYRSGLVPDSTAVFNITDDGRCLHLVRIEFGIYGVTAGSGTYAIGNGGWTWLAV